MTRGPKPGTRRVAGCDLGKSTAKLVTGRIRPDGELLVDTSETVVHEGRPLDVFREWYERASVASCDALGATGLHADGLRAPVLNGLPEGVCLEAALARVDPRTGPLNVVRVGARGYSVLVRDARGRVQHLENDKCSAGTGETMVKIAGRFGLSIEEADQRARGASEAIAITARCSVFSKSEMTHFANQGRPTDALLRGYFTSVAGYVAALLARARVEGPVLAVGGCARLGALVDALSEALDAPVHVPEDPLVLEAVGAMSLAAEQCLAEPLAPLPAHAADLLQARHRRFRVLEPAGEWADRVRRLEAPPVPPGRAREPSVLGLDLGSTGSKAVLVSLEDGEPVLDLYDRTRGNPVEAAQRLVAALLGQARPDVRAVALTGSGREAAATIVRAAFPERADHIVVMNEIVAHATAAMRCDEDGGRDLSVVEIGGQDAKFIRVVDGQIVESDMNKACSAGTGSFLEEQAVFYGVHDVERFAEMATRARRPPDLGQMCTVFVAEAAAEARGEGFSVEDLFGGFQYSVIHNYIHRVMGQRTFGGRIFFQGKPATGPSLAWTLAAVTGREVVVPPNPGAMGAWGIGLCALRELGRDALAASHALELGRVLEAEITDRGEFQCRDRRCATLCNIDRTTVRVGSREQKVVSGGACPKYEVATGMRPKLPVEAPSAFDERAAALAAFLAEEEGGGAVIGLPVLGASLPYAPFLAAFLRGLGFGVQPLRSDGRSLARGEERCFSFDACAPVKVAHGVLDAKVDRVLLPKVITVASPDGDGGRTCPMEQGLPEMVSEALRDRGSEVDVVHPTLFFAGGFGSATLLRGLFDTARRLGAPAHRVPSAARAAAAAQHDFERRLFAIGRRTLRWGREHGVPTIVVCGSLHVLHDDAVNASVPALLRAEGVLALPMDCFPVPPGVPALPRAGWGETRRATRVAVAARQRGDVYPLLLTSFGCGPWSFGEQVFSALMEGYPHTTLESDGHGGTAGYVTRVQAFLHTVRRRGGNGSDVPRDRMEVLEPPSDLPLRDESDARLVLFSMTDRLSPVLAAVYRSFGFDAVAPPPPSAETLALGRRDCSGKECLPYQLIWGAFRKHLEEDTSGRRTVLLQVTGQARCRNCMFSVKDRLNLSRLGLTNGVTVRHIGEEQGLGRAFLTRTWAALATWDILFQLAAWYRSEERREGEVDELYAQLSQELEALASTPSRGGVRGALDAARGGSDFAPLVREASLRFAELHRRSAEPPGLRTVLVSGDIYVRVDDFASDSLCRRLSARGLRVLVEPASLLPSYMASERIGDLIGLPTGLLDNALVRLGTGRILRELYGVAREEHPWLPVPDVDAAMRESRRLLDRHPQGEAPVTIGSVLHHWREGLCDGVVIASPWGCGPALLSESLLRHQRQIPMLFVYADGSPLDQHRLSEFAFRLRRSPRRSRDRIGSAPTSRSGSIPVWPDPARKSV